MACLNLNSIGRDPLEHILSLLPFESVLKLRESGDARLMHTLYATIRHLDIARSRNRPHSFAPIYSYFTRLESLCIVLFRHQADLIGYNIGIGLFPASLRSLKLVGDDVFYRLLPTSTDDSPTLVDQFPRLHSLVLTYALSTNISKRDMASTNWLISLLDSLPLTKLHINYSEHPVVLKHLPATLTDFLCTSCNGLSATEPWPVRWPPRLTAFTPMYRSVNSLDLSNLPTQHLTSLCVQQGDRLTPQQVIKAFNLTPPPKATFQASLLSQSPSQSSISSISQSQPSSYPASLTYLKLVLDFFNLELVQCLPPSLTHLELLSFKAPEDIDSMVSFLPRGLKHLHFTIMGPMPIIDGSGLPEGLLTLKGVAPTHWNKLPKGLKECASLERLSAYKAPLLFLSTLPPYLKIKTLVDITKDMINAFQPHHDFSELNIANFENSDALEALSRFSVCQSFTVSRPINLSKFVPGCKVSKLHLRVQWATPFDLDLSLPWASQLTFLTFESTQMDRERDDDAMSLFDDSPVVIAPVPPVADQIAWIKSLPHSLTDLQIHGCKLSHESMMFLPPLLVHVFMTIYCDLKNFDFPKYLSSLPPLLTRISLNFALGSISYDKIHANLEETVSALPNRLEIFQLTSELSRPFFVFTNLKKGPLALRPLLSLPYLKNFSVSGTEYATDFRTLLGMERARTLPLHTNDEVESDSPDESLLFSYNYDNDDSIFAGISD